MTKHGCTSALDVNSVLEKMGKVFRCCCLSLCSRCFILVNLFKRSFLRAFFFVNTDGHL